MTYCEAREYIKSLSTRGIVPGLDAIRALCEELGNPQDQIRAIHIAGTNGKGSTGAFVASILKNAGYNVGRYVSPAVVEYREIISINGTNISEEAYSDMAGCVRDAIEKIEEQGMYPTSFEAETAMAFLFFAKQKCDYALIECGMGGELDATNIIKKPVAAILTPIGIDHAKFLGNTIEEIAQNKAGIIKENTVVFSARQDERAMAVIEKKCNEVNAQLCVCEEPRIIEQSKTGTRFDYRNLNDIQITLAGTYQPINAALAMDVCMHSGIEVDVIRKGLRDTKWQLRFECDLDGWIFDGAHNPHSAQELAASVRMLLNGTTAYIIGVFADKEYEKILEITAFGADRIYTVTAPGERGLNSTFLAEIAKKYCNDVVDAKTVENAVRLCVNEKFDNVVVFGSLSFLNHIKQEKEKMYGEMSENI